MCNTWCVVFIIFVRGKGKENVFLSQSKTPKKERENYTSGHFPCLSLVYSFIDAALQLNIHFNFWKDFFSPRVVVNE